MNDYKPTARLRFVRRYVGTGTESSEEGVETGRFVNILQQWWGQELPAYLRDDSVGQWRDVPLIELLP